MSAAKKPSCTHCGHFFVTWANEFPGGCRAYAFRSPEYPSVVVLRESGIACQLFEPRAGNSPDEQPNRNGRLVH